MGIELKLHPQTALLMLIDALMSAGANYKLELYVENAGVGGVIWLLNDSDQTGQFLFADSDLAKLLSKFMQYVQQQPSEPAVQGEPTTVAEALAEGVLDPLAEPTPVYQPPAVYQESAAVADSTGVPE